MANQVAKKEEAGLPAEMMDDIFDTAGEGTTYEASELQIPFVRVAQGTSPQLKKSDMKYIADLRQGDIFNSVSNEIWDGEKGITVIPCYQVTTYPEFVAGDQGGGFVGVRAPDDPDLSQTTRVGAKEYLPNGNEVIKSDQHFCLILGEDGMYEPAIVDFKSTGLKVSRRWKTQIAMQKVKHPKTGEMKTPALFATMWKMTVVEESKTVEGELRTWYNWAIEKVGLVQDKALFNEAKLFREQVMKGEAKAQQEETPMASATPVDNTPVEDDDIPF